MKEKGDRKVYAYHGARIHWRRYRQKFQRGFYRRTLRKVVHQKDYVLSGYWTITVSVSDFSLFHYFEWRHELSRPEVLKFESISWKRIYDMVMYWVFFLVEFERFEWSVVALNLFSAPKWYVCIFFLFFFYSNVIWFPFLLFCRSRRRSWDVSNRCNISDKAYTFLHTVLMYTDIVASIQNGNTE